MEYEVEIKSDVVFIAEGSHLGYGDGKVWESI